MGKKRKKKIVIVNFSNHVINEDVRRGLGDTVVIHLPLEIDKDTNIAYYVDDIIDKSVNYESGFDSINNEWAVSYLIVLPGLSILAGMVCRNLSEKQIPYQIMNLVRSSDTGQFVIQDIY